MPYIFAWKGQLPAGKIYDRPVMGFDLTATALAVAGIKRPRNEADARAIERLTRLARHLREKEAALIESGDVTVARLLNPPRMPGFAAGQQVSVRDKQVVDWAWWNAGTLIGGATMRVLITRMPAAEARSMLDRFGW